MDKDENPSNQGKLLSEENERIFLDQILPSVTVNTRHREQAMAIFVGGQPGAGKSRLIHLLGKVFQNFSVINGDDLRSFHPRFEYFLKTEELDAADLTQPDCNVWVEKLIDYLSHHRESMIIFNHARNILIGRTALGDSSSPSIRIVA